MPTQTAETKTTPKRCATCGKTKIAPIEFYSNQSTKDGLNKSCIPCVKEYLRKRRVSLKTNPDGTTTATPATGVDKGKYADTVVDISKILLAEGLKWERAASVAQRIADEIVFKNQL